VPISRVINGRTITLSDDERQKCEVWTRIMGYYRPINDANIGKRSEFAERVRFSEQVALRHINEEEGNSAQYDREGP